MFWANLLSCLISHYPMCLLLWLFYPVHYFWYAPNTNKHCISHLHIFVQDIPSAWIPFPSLPIKFQFTKYLSFKTQLKCNLHKDSPDSHPNFPNLIISSSSKHQNIEYWFKPPTLFRTYPSPTFTKSFLYSHLIDSYWNEVK